jgi:hypothetical protein
MEVTPSGIIIDVKPQLKNAVIQIAVTLFGIVELLQPQNRVFVEVSIIALQPSLESYIGFPSSTLMDDRFLQLMKGEVEACTIMAPSPFADILVTLLGMNTDVNPQLAKAHDSIVFKLAGNSIEVSDLQFWKAYCPIEIRLSER